MVLADSTLAQSFLILVVLPIAGFVVAVAALWIAIWTAFKRPRLFYRIHAAVPLVDAPRSPGHGFRVHYDGDLVADPHLLSVQFITRCRDDIPATSYSGPITLDVGVRIVDILQVDLTGRDAKVPTKSFVDQTLSIGPCLIGKRQAMTITLLLDGCPDAAHLEPVVPIPNVRARKRKRLPAFLTRGSLAATAVATTADAAAFFVLWLLAASQVYLPETTPVAVSRIAGLTPALNALLSATTEHIYIALAMLAVTLAIIVGIASWAVGRNERAPWWLGL
jgi:hypothetical protein